MYNTSGSDIDIEEFEYHSGSRKVRKTRYSFHFYDQFYYLDCQNTCGKKTT
jgi:hypothetical protein